MLPRVAIIGPWEWSARFSDIGQSTPRMVLYFLGYRENPEIPDILSRCLGSVDGILFCGECPARTAAPHLPERFPTEVIKYDLHSMIRTLYEVTRDLPQALERGVTIDTLGPEDVKELCTELDLNPNRVQVQDFRGIESTSVKQVIEFHVGNYESGRVAALTTGMSAAHRELLANGLPAYYVRPTDAVLRDALYRIASAVHYARSANAQVAVMLIEAVAFERQGAEAIPSRSVTDREADLHSLLHTVAADTRCSLTVAGPGSYVVFASMQSLMAMAGESLDLPFVQEARRKYGATLNVGIGLGQTTADAHDHALTGLLHARRTGEGAVFAVHGDGTLTGPIYGRTNTDMHEPLDPRFSEVAKLARISVPTVATLIRWAQINNLSHITAADLSGALHVTPRTARRVLSALCDHDLARIVSEERDGVVGRPRYVYELALRRLSTLPTSSQFQLR